MRTLSSPAVTSLTEEDSDEVWLVLLTVTHNDLTSPIYIVNNNEDVISNGNRFIGMPFSIALPDESADQPGVAQVELPNVSGEIVDAVRTIALPPYVTIQVVLASSPSTIELQLDGLTMRECEWDAEAVRGSLRFETLTTEPICQTITPERFPALF